MIEVKKENFKHFLQNVSELTGYEFEYEKKTVVESDPDPVRGEHHHLAIIDTKEGGAETRNIHEPDFSRMLSEMLEFLLHKPVADGS